MGATGDRARKVFVVHGRDAAARDAVFAFLRCIDLQPLEWEEARSLTGVATPYVGQILHAALSHAQAIIVLLTGDDEAHLPQELRGPAEPPYEVQLTRQARPNVLFEAGMALGRFPKRTVLLEIGQLRPFSDIVGRHVVRLSRGSAGERQTLVNRLRITKCAVQTDGRTDWLELDFFEKVFAHSAP
jgi:predicted nucleotide-binding protein